MALSENHRAVTPSVLDRLLDFDPKSSDDSPAANFDSFEDYKRSVMRDLVWLLNSRRIPWAASGRDTEINRSVISYGLPDLTASNVRSTSEQKTLLDEISHTIETFDPRFMDVKVTLEPISNVERHIKFRIASKLYYGDTPVPVVFDTVLQLGSGDFSLREI